jgi:hypothetical protein
MKVVALTGQPLLPEGSDTSPVGQLVEVLVVEAAIKICHFLPST